MRRKQSIFERYPILQTIAPDRFPKHVLIIPDGNGRWAQQQNKPIIEGHKKGADVIEHILRDLSELTDIKIVTLWGFSSDNWKRSRDEIKGLMYIVEYKVTRTLNEVIRTGRRFIHLGRKDRIPTRLLTILEQAEELTKNSNGQIICLAIDFGGEDQELRVLEAARKIPDTIPISRDVLWQLRDAHGLIPAADLLIRTSGEKRTSDIGWLNGSQTELYFLEKYCPDVTTSDIIDALVDFSKRERRFGSRK